MMLRSVNRTVLMRCRTVAGDRWRRSGFPGGQTQTCSSELRCSNRVLGVCVWQRVGSDLQCDGTDPLGSPSCLHHRLPRCCSSVGSSLTSWPADTRANWQITGRRAATSQIHVFTEGVCVSGGRLGTGWRRSGWAHISPAWFWPNIVSSNCVIDTDCCRDLQRT